jgi:hypothetical protein
MVVMNISEESITSIFMTEIIVDSLHRKGRMIRKIDIWEPPTLNLALANTA